MISFGLPVKETGKAELLATSLALRALSPIPEKPTLVQTGLPEGVDSTMVSDPRLRVERGLEGLASIRPEWSAIIESMPGSRFHQSFEWHRCVLAHLEADPLSVHYFVLYRGSAAIAIFPLRCVVRRVAAIAVRTWESLTHDHVPLSDFVQQADIVADSPLRALLRALNSEPALRWDVLNLDRSPAGGPAMSAVSRGRWPLLLARRSTTSMYFDCSSYDGCQERMDGHFRRNLRRQRKKLDQRGRVEFVAESDPSALPGAFQEFLRLEQSGWKGDSGRASAIALHDRLRTFYESLICAFGREGHALITLLKLDGRPVAAQFCVLHGDTLNILKIAYDETYAAEAPGSQLLDALLRHCCDSPHIGRLCLTTGPEWATRWGPEADDCLELRSREPDRERPHCVRAAGGAHPRRRRQATLAATRKMSWWAAPRAPAPAPIRRACGPTAPVPIGKSRRFPARSRPKPGTVRHACAACCRNRAAVSRPPAGR